MRVRKGFSLVELLVVIAILAALAATMTASVIGSTAKAKAAVIMTNVDTCVKTVQDYYYTGVNDNPAKNTMNAATFMANTLPKWASFSTGTDIAYSVTGEANDVRAWELTVDFAGDSECDSIAEALSEVRGYDKGYRLDDNNAYVLDNDYDLSLQKGFKVILWNNRILTKN